MKAKLPVMITSSSCHAYHCSTSFPGPLFFPSMERERERDPGMVWSRASMKIEDAREGSLYFNCCCHFFVTVKTRLSCFVFNASVLAMFFSLSLTPWDGKKRDPGKEVDHC